MKPSILAATAALLMTTAAQAENATTLYSNNYWQTYHYARNSGGDEQCVMSAPFFTKDVRGKTVSHGRITLKFNQQIGWFMHVAKSSWKFPIAVKVPMTIVFDLPTDKRSADADAVKSETTDWGMLEWRFTPEQGYRFAETIGTSDTMVMSFKYGNERPWVANMTGSRKATEAFMYCVGSIGGDAGDTQPEAVPSQPSPPSNKGDKFRGA